ncbi:MAG TPA: phage tail assembly protein [Sinorhizobium sp.]|nr:phage tail assembly protein [Sinorhizobium sp.]
MVEAVLTKSYTVNGKTFDRVTLREPTYKDVYMDGLGQPREWQPVPGGQALLTYPERVDAYLQRLIVEPGYEYIHPLTAVDALRLEEATCGFFTERTAPSTPPTHSSSGLDGAQPTSSE